jgi:transcriptional regulator with XRE-family HTH domain
MRKTYIPSTATLFTPLMFFIFTNMNDRINRIKEVLVIKNMSQKELAAKLDKNPNTVTSMCNNKSQPHLKDLKIIAKILDVDIKDLLVATKE